MNDENKNQQLAADFVKRLSQAVSSEFDEVVNTAVVEEPVVANFDQISNISNEVVKNVELSIVEKNELEKFIENKNFNEVKKYPKETIQKYYIQGFESVDIVKLVPDTTVGGIVYLKTTEDWPKLRKDFLDNLEFNASFRMSLTKHRSISMITTLINVLHDKVEKGLSEYMLTGDKTKLPPNFTIKSFRDYEKFIKLLKQIDDLTTKNGRNHNPINPIDKNINPSFSINANNLIVDKSNTMQSYMGGISEKKELDLKKQQSLEFFQKIYEEEEDKENSEDE